MRLEQIQRNETVIDNKCPICRNEDEIICIRLRPKLEDAELQCGSCGVVWEEHIENIEMLEELDFYNLRK